MKVIWIKEWLAERELRRQLKAGAQRQALDAMRRVHAHSCRETCRAHHPTSYPRSAP